MLLSARAFLGRVLFKTGIIQRCECFRVEMDKGLNQYTSPLFKVKFNLDNLKSIM